MSTNEESIRWYDQNAAGYTKHVRDPDDSPYHSLYEKPAMYAPLPDLTDKRVLSLGCGSGEDCRYLKKQGAKSVTGIDISKGMIDIARQNPEGCSFEVMDMEHLAFEAESFDFVYSSLAIHYIEDWSQVMREVYRVLSPGGQFLFSCNHPVNTFAFEWTENDDTHYLRQLAKYKDKINGTVTIHGDYLARKSLRGGEEFAVTTWTKSLGEISQEIAQAGFVIKGIHEPRPLEDMKNVSPADYETRTKIPEFIIFKPQK